MDDRAVSPVVGMIMILAISVVGIAATIGWGMPAVDEMKATVEAAAVTNQFKELDRDVKQLVSGTADKTAKRWQPTLSRGSVVFEQGTERWIVGYSTCARLTVGCNDRAGADLDEYSWYLKLVSDNDNHIQLFNNRSILAGLDIEVDAYSLDNGAETAIIVSTDPANPTPMTSANAVPGTPVNLYLWNGAQKQNLDTTDPLIAGNVFKIVVKDNSNGDAEAAVFWIFDAGKGRFELDTTGSLKTVSLTNGAVIVGNGGHEMIDNQPGIPPPRLTPDGWQYFVRGVGFQGATSFGGESSFDILLTLYGTSALSNEDEIGEIYTYVGGTHLDAWEAHLSRGNGFRWGPYNGNVLDSDMRGWALRVGDGAGSYLPIGFTFVHSVVTVEQ